MAKDPIVLRPRKPKTVSGNRPTTPAAKRTSKKKSSSGSKKKSSAGYDARAAERRAIARENAAKKKAGKKYLAQAANLEAQAKALKKALNGSFGKARDQNLADISLQLNQQLTSLRESHGQRAQEFLKAGTDNEMATAGTAESGLSNLVRERQDSMGAILEQGAGETDTMRAMLMSARNWHANASEANRAYFDTARSVNAGITDLNVDTRTAMVNAFGTAEGQRESVWQDFYNRRSESLTQLGNIRGQQADYYASAREMGLKPAKREKRAKKDAEKAFKDAAKEAGKSYEQQAAPDSLQKWEGQEQIDARQSNSQLQAAMTLGPMARAEGATLRRWAA